MVDALAVELDTLQIVDTHEQPETEFLHQEDAFGFQALMPYWPVGMLEWESHCKALLQE